MLRIFLLALLILVVSAAAASASAPHRLHITPAVNQKLAKLPKRDGAHQRHRTLAAAVNSSTATTADEAINTPYSNSELFRPRGQAGPSGFGWNDPIPANAQVDPDSPAERKFLTDQLGGSWDNPGHWWWNWFDVYTVGPNTPVKSVCFTGADNWASGWGDYVQTHKNFVLNKVPIPTDGLPYLDGGSDNGATIYQPASNAAWDLYEFQPGNGKVDSITGKKCDYLADVGQKATMVGQHGVGYNRDGSTYPITYQWWQTSPGYYRQNPPSEFSDVARRAAKTPVIAGNITPQEFNHPDPVEGFGHKLQVTLPWTRCVYDASTGTCSQKQGEGYQWPAHAMDNWSAWGFPAIKEGAIMRFDAATDCTPWDNEINTTSDPQRKLYLERIRGLCVTMKRYGAVGTDQTGNGFSINFAGGGALDPDGGYCCAGTGANGPHWPSQYIDPIWVYFRDHLETLKEPDHVEWTPGCRC